MLSKIKTMGAVCALTAFATGALADGWTLDPAMSNVSFGSIKNDYVGESHHFGGIKGTVTEEGEVTIGLDLSSVQTNIDIRNERMIDHVFNKVTTATVSASIDMEELEKLAVGEATTIETPGTLKFLGQEMELDAQLFVLRLAEDKVLVTTNGMVMLSTEDAGINAGVDVLQELAGLDSITRVSPVTLRLIFNEDR